MLTQIHEYVSRNSLGEVFPAPLDVFLDENSNEVQPDILFVSTENTYIIDENCIRGVPDFIIEILSPGNKKHDQITKKSLYEKVGVKEYWIIDPETKSVAGFALKASNYQLLPEAEGKIASALLAATFTF